jgi:AhpD family alkylhydroperoxidase
MTDDVQVANRRLDAHANEALIGMARMGAHAFGYTADLRIDRHLAQLLRLRVSQLNNCTYCLNLHYQAAREAGIPRAKLDTLTAWWETEVHSEAEQAALRYAEGSPAPPTPTGTRHSSISMTRSPSTSARTRCSRSSPSSSI